MKSCQDLTFRKFSRRFNPPQKKGGFTLWNYHQFFKNFQTKTKPVVRGYIYWLDSRYTMSDGKNKLFLNCYTNIRDTMHLSCLTFRMDGASTRAILCCGWACESYCSKVIVWEMRDNLLSLRKICSFNKTLNVFLWSPSWLGCMLFL